MTEELKKEETPKEEVKEVPEVEVKAKESGWMPEEEWKAAGKDVSKWRPAKEYVDRGELLSEIERIKQELKQTTGALGSLKQHHLRVRDSAYQEAYKTLKKEMEAAKRNEDVTKVMDLKDEMEELKKKETAEKAELNKVPSGPSIAPEFVEWHSQNAWYKLNGKDAMSVYAASQADDFVREKLDRGEKYSNKDVYEFVDKRMREEFPEKFRNAKREEAPKVEGGGGEGRPSKGTSRVTLTDLEEKICRDLVKTGVMTREQYIKDLEKYDRSH